MMYPNIDAERARNGMSMEQFANNLGVSRKTIYNWIRKGNIPQKRLIQISELFKCTIDYLLGKSPFKQ